VKKIRALIVEDEPLAREKLRRLLRAEADIVVVAECADGRTAVASIHKHRPELVFLDVRLPGMSGFDVLKSLKDDLPPAVIFVTAFDHATRAFDSDATDYLLKPFSSERFKQALERARKRVTRHSSRLETLVKAVTEHQKRPSAAHDTISFRVGTRIVLVRTDEIQAIVAARIHSTIHTEAQRYRTRRTLSEFENDLKCRGFIRINRSTIINRQHVHEIVKKTHGDGIVRLKSGKEFSSSRRYRAAWSLSGG